MFCKGSERGVCKGTPNEWLRRMLPYHFFLALRSLRLDELNFIFHRCKYVSFHCPGFSKRTTDP